MTEAENRTAETSIVPASPEEKLGSQVSVIEQQAMSVTITDEASYQAASELVINIKATAKQVTDYWEPMRVSAKKTYDDILAKKKEMLSPLESSERIIKGKIAGFLEAEEAKTRAAAEEAKRQAKKESEAKLAEAVEAAENGDTAAAEYAMMEAEVMDDAANSSPVAYQKPKAEGVSYSRSWEITEVDDKQVPVKLNGMTLRPVDTKAILALIKASKGEIEIPGIKFKETKTISVRGK